MIKNLTIFVLSLFSMAAYPQITMTPDTKFAQCPGVSITYTVNYSLTNSCIFEWKVTNGKITGGVHSGNVSTFTGGNLVTIVWSDETSGKINVKARNCNPPGDSEQTFDYAILSLKGVTPGSIESTNPNPTVNITSNVIYKVPQINFPKIGSDDVDPKEVNSYEWEIPNGWTVVSGSTTKSITVKPDDCSGGTMRVRGKSTLCTGVTYYSNWSPVLTIKRTIGTPGAISGSDVVYCFDASVRQYSVPEVAGATSYSWTTPSGWSGSSTTSSIDLTPNGLSGGQITVKAKGCGIESATSAVTVTLAAYDTNSPPTITPDIVCSSATFALANQPAGPAFSWSSSAPGALSINSSSGLANRINNYKGTVTITAARAGEGSCGALSFTKDILVGPPKNEGFAEGAGMMTEFDILYTYSIPNPGATSYSWSISNTNLVKQRFTSDSAAITISLQRFLNQEGVVNISLTSVNDCGSSIIGPRAIRVGPCPGHFNNTGCGSVIERTPGDLDVELSVFPNPTSNELIVKLSENKPIDEQEFMAQPIAITLFNLQGEVVYTAAYTGESMAIPVNEIPRGQYIAQVKQNGKVLTRTIRIEH